MMPSLDEARLPRQAAGVAPAVYRPTSDRQGRAEAAPSVRLLTFTTLYPNAAHPNHGIFVENRLRHLVGDGRVHSTVLAPVPWFPSRSARFGRWARHASVPYVEERFGLTVHHPRFVAVPRLGRLVNPDTLYHAASAAVARLLDDGHRFDAIDAHFLYPDGVAAVRLGRRFELPVLLTARGSDASVLPFQAIPGQRIARAVAAADAVIAVSAGLKAGLVAAGAAPERVTVLRNGVDLTLFRPVADRAAGRAALGLSGPLLLSIGILIERKGHHRVIEALRELPDHTLMIVGEGEAHASLVRLAGRLGVAARVRFMGAQPHDRLARFYSAADVMVLASSREGWANVLLESMACGTPVVCTPTWGAREAVASPAAGVVLEDTTPEAIAAAVRHLRRVPPDRAATRRYAEGFGWGPTTAGQVALLERVLGRPV